MRSEYFLALGTVFGLCVIVGSVMGVLWLTAGSGNANFVYFQSLLYLGCEAYLLLDAIGAARKFVVKPHAT